MTPDQLPFSPATERNREPIRAVLVDRLESSGRLLEIGAGTGQHAVYLGTSLPGWRWLPTDRQVVLPGLQARLTLEAPPNIEPARALDVRSDPWPEGPFDAAFSANTAHIMPWPVVCSMLTGVGASLRDDGQFFLYGPFNRGGSFTSPGNEAFDAALRQRDGEMGLRDVEALESQAARHQMTLKDIVSMPANNVVLVLVKSGSGS